VLDIACKTGAELFELCNFDIAISYGIELDADKVYVAGQVSNYLELSQLTFEVVDIETLLSGALLAFNLTFALAVEGYLLDKDHFSHPLGEVTEMNPYFEANRVLILHRSKAGWPGKVCVASKIEVFAPTTVICVNTTNIF
jgi:hypothetical protein